MTRLAQGLAAWLPDIAGALSHQNGYGLAAANGVIGEPSCRFMRRSMLPGHRTRPAIASQSASCRSPVAETVPLGDNRQRVGTLDGIIATCSIRSASRRCSLPGAPPDRTPAPEHRPTAVLRSRESTGSRMSSVRGLNASPQIPTVFLKTAEVFAHHREELALHLVHLFDGAQDREVILLLGGEAPHRLDVFGKQPPP